jgi:membrane protein involved in colicin uptake
LERESEETARAALETQRVAEAAAAAEAEAQRQAEEAAVAEAARASAAAAEAAEAAQAAEAAEAAQATPPSEDECIGYGCSPEQDAEILEGERLANDDYWPGCDYQLCGEPEY